MRDRSRFGEAAQRFAERRRREDEAPRLREQVPSLASLRLELEDRRPASLAAESKHIRHVVVDNAPALFFVPCVDPACRDGGHDVTYGILRSLASGAPSFEGEDTCHGSIGTAECGHILHFRAIATYR